MNTAKKESKDPFIGSTLAGKYTIESLIGKGGIGRVYKAKHTILSRSVAIKVLRQRDFNDPKEEARERQRFDREARLATQLRHPNAVMIYDYGFGESGHPYLSMEHLEGMDLDKMIAERGAIPWKEAIPIVRQVLRALIEAHEKHNIIHRDLKPSNIFILPQDSVRTRRQDWVKVLDFGAAKLAGKTGDTERLTLAGELVGTWYYMAPEQAMSEDIGPRTDLYSLGMLTYEMLEGCLPFDGQNQQAYLMAKMTSEPKPFAEDSTTPKELQDWVMRAMQRKQEDRFQDAIEALEALNTIDPDFVPNQTPASNTELLPHLSTRRTGAMQSIPTSSPSIPARTSTAPSTLADDPVKPAIKKRRSDQIALIVGAILILGTLLAMVIWGK